jgi:hypothetical protein
MQLTRWACPKLVTNGINVMSHRDRWTRISVAINRLIVHLQNELARIERLRPIGVHAQVRDGLIGEEIWLAFKHL